MGGKDLNILKNNSLTMNEKTHTSIGRENVVVHFSIVERDFLNSSNLTISDVWRSKMNGGRMVDSFDQK